MREWGSVKGEAWSGEGKAQRSEPNRALQTWQMGPPVEKPELIVHQRWVRVVLFEIAIHEDREPIMRAAAVRRFQRRPERELVPRFVVLKRRHDLGAPGGHLPALGAKAAFLQRLLEFSPFLLIIQAQRHIVRVSIKIVDEVCVEGAADGRGKVWRE